LKKWAIFTLKQLIDYRQRLLEHDFIIQYKKGEIMPADYLSQLPSANLDTIAEVMQCFDPFQPDLIDMQRADLVLQ
jgi:hypothetical protein